MNREFEFFITEQDAKMKVWAEQKKDDGSIFVKNAEEVIDQLEKLTQPNDTIICKISGAWIEECVEKSVRRLLHPVFDNQLSNRTISGVIVDLTTSVAYGDRDLTIEERRSLLTHKLDTIATDPRLTMLS